MTARDCHYGRVIPGALLLLLLAAAPLAAQETPAVAPAEATDEAGSADVILVVDASGSMTRTDPAGTGGSLLKLLLDFTTGSQGHIGVVRFGGWDETGTDEALMMAPVALPEDEQARRGVLAEAVEAVNRAIATRARASDFNAAFERAVVTALDAIPGDPAPDRDVFCLVLSDGAMEVVEGSGVRDLYLQQTRARLPENADIDRDLLNQTALTHFRDSVLPALPKGLRIAVLWPRGDGSNTDTTPPALEAIAASGRGEGKLVPLGDQPLWEAFRQLISAGPWSGQADRALIATGQGEASPGEATRVQLPLLEGTQRARAVLLATHHRYRLSVVGPAADHARIHGQGERHKVIHLDEAAIAAHLAELSDAVAPTLELLVEPMTGAPALQFERLLAVELALESELVLDANEVTAGEMVDATLQVRAVGGSGSPLRDPRLLATLRGIAALANPSADATGSPEPTVLTWAAEQAEARISLPTDVAAAPGVRRLGTSWSISHPTGETAEPGGRLLAQGNDGNDLTIWALGHAGFEQRVCRLGEVVTVELQVTAGSPAAAHLWLDLGVNATSEHSLKLDPEEGNLWRGSFQTNELGTWSIAEQRVTESLIQVLPAEDERNQLQVVGPLDGAVVELVVVDGSGGITRILSSLVIGPPDPPDQPAEVRFTARPLIPEGLVCTAASLVSGSNAPPPAVSLSGLTPNADGTLSGTLRLDTSAAVPPGQPPLTETTELTLWVTIEVGDHQGELAFPVQVVPPTPDLLPWLLAAAAAALVAAMVVALLLRGPRFNQQQVWRVPSDGQIPSERTLLSDHASGWRHHTARDLPVTMQALSFRLASPRSDPRCELMVTPGVALAVEAGGQLAAPGGEPVQVTHGTPLVLGGGEDGRAIYFDSDPSEEELAAARWFPPLDDDEMVLVEDDL